MNPFVWRREHQVAVILGAVLGAAIVEVIGFMYRGLNFGITSSDLFWSARLSRRWDRAIRRKQFFRAIWFPTVAIG